MPYMIDKFNKTDKLKETLEGTPVLLKEISEFNGYLKPGQVLAALFRGDTVYTEFSYYKMHK